MGDVKRAKGKPKTKSKPVQTVKLDPRARKRFLDATRIPERPSRQRPSYTRTTTRIPPTTPPIQEIMYDLSEVPTGQLLKAIREKCGPFEITFKSKSEVK